jgi:tRNA(Ile)-lysidine synthase
MRGAQPDRALATLFAQHTSLAAGERAIVALSGGSDSVALASLCAEYAEQCSAQVTLVHIDHAIRTSAQQDEAVALAVASRLRLPIIVRRLNGDARDEASLRTGRYDALVAAAHDCDARKILTGHTADDQTETVLLALFRGTGRDGLRGMPTLRPLDDATQLERPLLAADRAVLRRYCERRQLPYVLDPTNSQTNYRRNAVRVALQALRPLFPGLDQAVARCAEILQEEDAGPASAAIAYEVRAWLKEHGVTRDVSRERLGAVLQLIELGRGRRVWLALDNNEINDRGSADRGSPGRKEYDGEQNDFQG